MTLCHSNFTLGIQDYVLFTGVAGAAGLLLQKIYDDYNAKRDAMFRHYIALHPEDFPMPGWFLLT